MLALESFISSHQNIFFLFRDRKSVYNLNDDNYLFYILICLYIYVFAEDLYF